VTQPVDRLRSVPYFAELPEQLLAEVARGAKEIEVGEGETVIREGEAAETAYVVISGELEVTKASEGRQVVLSRVGPGEVQGEMALLEDTPRGATVTAITPARLLEISAGSFRELLDDPSFVLSMLTTVIRRLRSTESALRHEERMAALGKMAAQLMHELNNPAAALSRSVAELGEVYDHLGNVAVALGSTSTDDIPGPRSGRPDSALKRSIREAEVEEWLLSKSVPEPWRLATPLVEDGWAVPDLERLVKGVDDASAATLAEWVGMRCLAGQLIDEIRLGASRISELVRVVKGYSFLDQGPIQEVDVRSGIDDTLILLKHKLDNVEIVTDYEKDLPTVEAPGRDINQVWTNLIDNAADAMDGGGELRISARAVDDGVEVTVANTGPPIPDDVLPRIFDPFYTTKEPGKGTGLGLHTLHTILTRMGATVDVESDEVGTRFRVTLPLSSERHEAEHRRTGN